MEPFFGTMPEDARRLKEIIKRKASDWTPVVRVPSGILAPNQFIWTGVRVLLSDELYQDLREFMGREKEHLN